MIYEVIASTCESDAWCDSMQSNGILAKWCGYGKYLKLKLPIVVLIITHKHPNTQEKVHTHTLTHKKMGKKYFTQMK